MNRHSIATSHDTPYKKRNLMTLMRLRGNPYRNKMVPKYCKHLCDMSVSTGKMKKLLHHHFKLSFILFTGPMIQTQHNRCQLTFMHCCLFISNKRFQLWNITANHFML